MTQKLLKSALIALLLPTFSTLALTSITKGEEAPPHKSKLDSTISAVTVRQEVIDGLLQWKQQASIQSQIASVLEHQNELLHSRTTPVVNNLGNINIIVFFDYQCIYCAKATPMLEQIAHAHPNLRLVFKEWPIFQHRWPASLNAAQTGLTIWKENGADTYFRYHNAIFATNHNEGKLTSNDVRNTLDSLQIKGNHLDSEYANAELSSTDALATKLGLHGTPAFIIMPTEGASIQNTTILPGMVDAEILEAAIYNAQQQNNQKRNQQ